MAGLFVALQRSFAYRVSQTFPGSFVRWIDEVSNFLDSIILTSTVFDLDSVVGPSASLASTLPTTSRASAIVAGYTTKGDGGGGQFYWDSTSVATVVPGMIVKPTATVVGRWIRIYSGSVDLRWLGAALDGITDDRAAWVAGVAYLRSLPNGGTLKLPAAVSFVSSSGAFDVAIDCSNFVSPQALTIEGISDDGSVVLFNGQDYGFSAQPFENLTFRHLNIQGGCGNAIYAETGLNLRAEGLTFDGAHTKMPAIGPGAAFRFGGVTGVYFDDLKFIGNGVANDQSYNVVAGFGVDANNVRVSNLDIQNGAARFGFAFYGGTDLTGSNWDINLGGAANGNGSNNGYPVLLYNLRALNLKRNALGTIVIRNSAGTGIYIASGENIALADIVADDVCQNQTDASLGVGAITAAGNHITIDGLTCNKSGKAGVSIIGNFISVANATFFDCGTEAISIRYNDDGLVLDNVTSHKAARHLRAWPDTSVRNLVVSNFRGTLSSTDGMTFEELTGARLSNVIIQDSVGRSVSILSGADNELENVMGQYCDDYIFDIRSNDTRLINCRTKASAVGGAIVRGARATLSHCNFSGNGTPGTITGSVDLSTLTLPGDLTGKTLQITSTDYQSGQTTQTITFTADEVNVGRVLDKISVGLQGACASLTAATHLRLRTENGRGTIAVTGGTALADLGLAISANTGAAMSEVEVNAIGDDCDMIDNRYTLFGSLAGSCVLFAGVATVFTEEVREGDVIEIDNLVLGGTQGSYSVAITDGVSFTITSTSNTDTSNLAWRIQHRPFRPSDIPTLTFWTRSDPDSALTQVAAGVVLSETMKSGIGSGLVAAVGQRPVYKGYSASLAGLPTKTFDGVDDKMTSGIVLSTIKSTTDCEVFASFNITSIPSNHAPTASYFLNAFLIGDSQQYFGIGMRDNAAPKIGIYNFSGATETVDEISFTLGVKHYIDAIQDSGTGKLRMSIDGGAFSAGTATGATDLQNGTMQKGTLGGSFLAGEDAEQCIFSGVLTNAQRTRMRAYMNARVF